MSMNKPVTLLALVAALGYLMFSAAYTISEREQVVITQFGKPVGEPLTEAGLKFKLPFIQSVNSIDKRILEWDGNPSDMPTKDKLYISVDLFARWRITDPLQYFYACVMSAVRSLALTIFWAARPAMRLPA